MKLMPIVCCADCKFIDVERVRDVDDVHYYPFCNLAKKSLGFHDKYEENIFPDCCPLKDAEEENAVS